MQSVLLELKCKDEKLEKIQFLKNSLLYYLIIIKYVSAKSSLNVIPIN